MTILERVLPDDDLVPAASVEGLLAAVTAGLDQLYAQVVRAEQDADDAEQELWALHAAPDGSTERLSHLYRSLDELTRVGTDYFRAEVEAAHARAAARVAEAEAHAEWLLVDAHEQVAHLLSVAGAESASQAMGAAARPTSVGPAHLAAPPPTGPPVLNPDGSQIHPGDGSTRGPRSGVAPAAGAKDAPVPDGGVRAGLDPDPEAARFDAFWTPTQHAPVVQAGPLEGTPLTVIPMLVAAMAGLVLLVLVGALAWIG